MLQRRVISDGATTSSCTMAKALRCRRRAQTTHGDVTLRIQQVHAALLSSSAFTNHLACFGACPTLHTMLLPSSCRLVLSVPAFSIWYTTALLCFPSGYDSIRQVRICLVTHQHRIIDIRKMQLAGTTVPRVQLPSPVLLVEPMRGKVTEAKLDRTTLEICTLASTIGSSNKYLPGCVSLEQALHSSEPFFEVYPP